MISEEEKEALKAREKAEKEQIVLEVAKTLIEGRKEELKTTIKTLEAELKHLEKMEPSDIAKETLERLKEEEAKEQPQKVE